MLFFQATGVVTSRACRPTLHSAHFESLRLPAGRLRRAGTGAGAWMSGTRRQVRACIPLPSAFPPSILTCGCPAAAVAGWKPTGRVQCGVSFAVFVTYSVIGLLVP